MRSCAKERAWSTSAHPSGLRFVFPVCTAAPLTPPALASGVVPRRPSCSRSASAASGLPGKSPGTWPRARGQQHHRGAARVLSHHYSHRPDGTPLHDSSPGKRTAVGGQRTHMGPLHDVLRPAGPPATPRVLAPARTARGGDGEEVALTRPASSLRASHSDLEDLARGAACAGNRVWGDWLCGDHHPIACRRRVLRRSRRDRPRQPTLCDVDGSAVDAA